jgi:hypothetical protein
MCSETADILRFMSSNNSSLNIDQNLSIYIPYIVEQDVNEEYIKNILYSLNIGIVKRIDFQPKYSTYMNNSGKSAFIHMERWFESTMVENLQKKILNDEELDARVVHDDPRYWVLKRNKRPIPDNYAEQLANLQKSVDKSNKQMVQRIGTLENTIDELKWWARLHDTNIEYICNKLHTNNVVLAAPVTQTSNDNMITFDTVWEHRLRKRAKSDDYDKTY